MARKTDDIYDDDDRVEDNSDDMDDDLFDEEGKESDKEEAEDENEDVEPDEKELSDDPSTLSEEDLNNQTKKHFLCPKCGSYYVENNWVRNPGPTLAILKSGLAYCDHCIKKIFDDDFIGKVEIHDSQQKVSRDKILEIAERIERTLESNFEFERIISTYDEEGVLVINTNTTELARAIGKSILEEYKGGIEYCWVEKNQFLIVKWFDELDNSNYFKERLRQKKDRFPGSMFFDEDDK